MSRHPTKRDFAAIECATLDLAILTDQISATVRSGKAAVTAMLKLDAAMQIAALDEVERMENLDQDLHH